MLLPMLSFDSLMAAYRQKRRIQSRKTRMHIGAPKQPKRPRALLWGMQARRCAASAGWPSLQQTSSGTKASLMAFTPRYSFPKPQELSLLILTARQDLEHVRASRGASPCMAGCAERRKLQPGTSKPSSIYCPSLSVNTCAAVQAVRDRGGEEAPGFAPHCVARAGQAGEAVHALQPGQER